MFRIDLLAFTFFLIVVGIGGILYLRLRRSLKKFPCLKYSSTKHFTIIKNSWKVRLGPIPKVFKISALLLLIIAFIDPHFLFNTPVNNTDTSTEIEKSSEEISIATEGTAIYFVLDQSGSMSEIVNFTSEDGKNIRRSRIEIMKYVTSQFIGGNYWLGLSGRKNDMIGIIAFARIAEVLSPLTLDHNTILDKLAELETIKHQEREGTAIGYAIFKTANLITATRRFAIESTDKARPSYEIKSTSIILVTDGLQNPNPLDRGHILRNMSISDAAGYASKNNIRLYIVNIEPAIRLPQFTNARKELKTAAEATGGSFYIADDPTHLQRIYAEIDSLERSPLPEEKKLHADVIETMISPPEQYRQASLYPYFIAGGLVLLMLSIFISTIIIRRVP